MGQPVSKRHATTAPIPPFENYHVYTGPPPQPQQLQPYVQNQIFDQPPAGRPGPDYGPQEPDYGPPRQRPLPRRSDLPLQGPPGRFRPAEEDFWDDEGDDPVYLPEPAGPRRGRPGGRNFDPFAEDPRRYPPPGPGGVSRQRGYAGDLIEGMRQQRIDPGRAQQYRSPPQAAYCPPQAGYQQPRIVKRTTYVNEPAGYAPPAQQSLAYQPPAQQLAPQQSGGTQPTVIYYDPQTGQVTGSSANQQQQQQPQVISYQQPAQQQQPQVISYPQGGLVDFSQGQQAQQPFAFPGMQGGFPGFPQMMMMQQPAQQAQPIVVPGQLYTADRGMQRLG